MYCILLQCSENSACSTKAAARERYGTAADGSKCSLRQETGVSSVWSLQLPGRPLLNGQAVVSQQGSTLSIQVRLAEGRVVVSSDKAHFSA